MQTKLTIKEIINYLDERVKDKTIIFYRNDMSFSTLLCLSFLSGYLYGKDVPHYSEIFSAVYDYVSEYFETLNI
jgi:hypothetical protein